MPLYKVNGVKKDGLQKYNVRVNYISVDGGAKQLTRTAYGLEAAKDLERRLTAEYKQTRGVSTKKITVQQLFDEYIVVKQYEVKETTVEKYRQTFEYYIASTFKDIHIDKLTPTMVQDWKLSMEKKGLSLNTKRHAFSDFRAMINYAIRMEYIDKNPLTKVGTFKDKGGLKREIVFYTAQEFTQFISAAKKVAEEEETKHKVLSEAVC